MKLPCSSRNDPLDIVIASVTIAKQLKRSNLGVINLIVITIRFATPKNRRAVEAHLFNLLWGRYVLTAQRVESYASQLFTQGPKFLGIGFIVGPVCGTDFHRIAFGIVLRAVIAAVFCFRRGSREKRG